MTNFPQPIPDLKDAEQIGATMLTRSGEGVIGRIHVNMMKPTDVGRSEQAGDQMMIHIRRFDTEYGHPRETVIFIDPNGYVSKLESFYS